MANLHLQENQQGVPDVLMSFVNRRLKKRQNKEQSI